MAVQRECSSDLVTEQRDMKPNKRDLLFSLVSPADSEELSSAAVEVGNDGLSVGVLK